MKKRLEDEEYSTEYLIIENEEITFQAIPKQLNYTQKEKSYSVLNKLKILDEDKLTVYDKKITKHEHFKIHKSNYMKENKLHFGDDFQNN